MDQAVMQKWEYHVEETSNLSGLREILARLGKEGWELVSVTTGNGVDGPTPVKTLRHRKEAYCAFFKRPGD